MAWPFLLPWTTELICRSGAVSLTTGVPLVVNTRGLAIFIVAFYALREVSFLIKGEPASALNPSAQAQIGDCLPSNAVLGGQFRLDKVDLEETGRAVFVPARARAGLYIGSGLAMLTGLLAGVFQIGAHAGPPWLLGGAVVALVGRQVTSVPQLPGKRSEDGGGAADPGRLWRREGPRLVLRFGELFWIGCCLMELRQSEALPGWLAQCELPA